MYNLFVSGNDKEWNGAPFKIELSRCVREYTDAALTIGYGNLDATSIVELKALPCIFAYEKGIEQDPKFGVIREITKRPSEVKIEYDIKPLDKFISWQDIQEWAFELGIYGHEMFRTHWAVKEVNLAKELRAKNIILPPWVRTVGKTVNIENHHFDVALSFPGEVRDYVERVSIVLEDKIGPNLYFYDNNYVSQLARPSLDTLLQDIYRNRSKLIVVFLCQNYQDKEWCGIEFRAIKEIIMQREHQRIMFVRMDEGHVDGVFKTDGYVDGRRFSPEQVAHFIQERISLLTP